MDTDDETIAHLAANIAWLEAADPDDWHRVALDFNWSEQLFLLDWIVRQRDCDIATALTIFWQGEPSFWLDTKAKAGEPDGYGDLNAALCIYIAARVADGGYGRSEIAFRPDTWTKAAYTELTSEVAALAQPAFHAHPDLIRSRDGREVTNDWDFVQRYPQEFQLSSYSEPRAPDGDWVVYEPPGFAERWAQYEAVERDTHDRLPAWLKDPERTTLAARARAFMLDDRHVAPLVIACNACVIAIIAGGCAFFGTSGRPPAPLWLAAGVLGMAYCLYRMRAELAEWQQRFADRGTAADRSAVRAVAWAAMPAFPVGALAGYWAFGAFYAEGGLGGRALLLVQLAAVMLVAALAAAAITAILDARRLAR